MSYENFQNQTRSLKVVLAHIESLKKFKVFSLVSGAIYKRSVDFFAIGASVNGLDLIQASSSALNSGEFYFDIEAGELFIRLSDDSDPSLAEIFVKFKHFYSNFPQNLPFDLDSGSEVYYEPAITRIGDLKLELDYENTGIAIESDSSINLLNDFFINIFDSHIWENQRVSIYSWSPSILPSESRLIYKGFINNKSYSENDVGFNLRDQLSQLKQTIQMGRFSSLDGELSANVLDKPKRLVFGRCKQLRTVGIDKVLTGYPLTGTISGSADLNLLTGVASGLSGSNIITGTGTLFLTQIASGERIKVRSGIFEYSYTVDTVLTNTSLQINGTISVSFSNAEARNLDVQNNVINGVGTDFVNELSQGDKINLVVLGEKFSFGVKSINSATQLLIDDSIELGFTNTSATVSPVVNYRGKNRFWHVAGHKLYEFQTTITSVLSPTIIEVADIGDIEESDYIVIDSQVYTVTNVAFSKISLNQSIPITVVAGFAVTKIPIAIAYGESNEFIIDRDFTVSNIDEAIIEFNDLAEFNIAQVKNPILNFQFLNGSNIVTSLTTIVNLTTIYKPRDWIKIKKVDAPTWYEILEVSENTFKIRETYSGANYTGLIQTKSPEYFDDNSLITCNCLGLSDNGEWIRYPAQAVRYVLGEMGVTDINEQSFIDSKESCEFELSIFFPTSIGSELPDCRKIITDINNSVFGSLYIDSDFNFSYSILNAEKPETIEYLDDSDILNFSVSTRNSIVSDIVLQYRPFTDIYSSSDVFDQIIKESDFVGKTSKIKNTLQAKSYLYHLEDALVIAERWLFFRSLTQSILTLNAKLNLASKSLNDKLAVRLDRLYKRYGSNSNIKIGVISSITKDDLGVQVKFNDIGNVFNRVPAICPNDQVDYSTASDLEIAKYGFVVDNDFETPDLSENELGNNLIG